VRSVAGKSPVSIVSKDTHPLPPVSVLVVLEERETGTSTHSMVGSETRNFAFTDMAVAL
jgi:hypothetical protein